MNKSIDQWLSRRIRVLCALAIGVSSLLPPYIPKNAIADSQETPSSQFLLVEDGFIYKTSSVSLQGSRIAYSKAIMHTVAEGESLEKLANIYNISIDTIKWANNITNENPIKPGQDLRILPINGVLHKVKPGQTLIQIAEEYATPLEKIIAQNGIKNGFILSGQDIIIPDGVPPRPVEIIAVTPKPITVPTKTPLKIEAITKVTPKFSPTPTYGLLHKPCSATCFVTQYYNANHYALDMQERGGGPIYAAEDGVVIKAKSGWNGGYGNVIEIDHGNGMVTLYGHNKTLLVRDGDSVKRGEKIADMGNTGLVYGKTGIHTHFEVRIEGVKKNPLLYIQ